MHSSFRFIFCLLFALVTTAPEVVVAQNVPNAQTKPRNVGRNVVPSTEPAGEVCTVQTTTTPPFYVNNAPDSKPYTDFSQRPDGAVINGFVPKGSVVMADGDGPNMFTFPSTWIPIHVISVPDAQTAEHARRSPQEMAQAFRGLQGTRVQVGAKGYLRSADLIKAGSTTFTVRQDSPLLQIGNDTLDLQGRAVRLSTNLLGYKVNRCCPASSGGSGISGLLTSGLDTAQRVLNTNSQCHDNYMFDVLGSDLSTVERTFALNLNTCQAFIRGLEAIDGRQTAALAGISRSLASDPQFGIENVEYIPGANLLKIPNIPNPQNPECNIGPFGSCHYWRNPNNGASETARNTGASENNNADVSFDSYMNPVSACTFMRVMEEWQRTCHGPGCAIQWGDAYSNAAWGAHDSHGNESCIDIRPPRTDSSVGPITYRSGDYDRNKTAALIQLMIRAGANTAQLGFQDPEMMRRFGTKNWPGHDNHIHVCFPFSGSSAGSATSSQIATTARTCTNGLNPAGQPQAQPGILSNIYGMLRRN